MKRNDTDKEENLAITPEEIYQAVEKLESFYNNVAKRYGNSSSPTRKPKNTSKHLYLRMKQDPNSPIRQIREGKPIKIKTIFHAVEVQLKDIFGSTFSCEYHIQNTIKNITNELAKSYPPFSKSDIEKLAKQNDKEYEETKNLVVGTLAQNIIDMRVAVARFFHEQLEPTLKIVLHDLITDAGLVGLEKFGYKLSNGSDYEKVQKLYSQLRRKRIAAIKSGIGRPLGSLSIDEVEFNRTIDDIKGLVKDFEKKNQAVTKHAIARKLYPQNSNPLQKLNRFLKRYEITFLQIVNDKEINNL